MSEVCPRSTKTPLEMKTGQGRQKSLQLLESLSQNVEVWIKLLKKCWFRISAFAFSERTCSPLQLGSRRNGMVDSLLFNNLYSFQKVLESDVSSFLKKAHALAFLSSLVLLFLVTLHCKRVAGFPKCLHFLNSKFLFLIVFRISWADPR